MAIYKKLVVIVVFLLTIGSALAGQMQRTLPAKSVNPGQTFEIVYSTKESTTTYWFVDEGFPNGFNPVDEELIYRDNWADDYELLHRARFANKGLPYKLKVKAPTVSGTYTFDEGYYGHWKNAEDQVDDVEKFPDLEITVNEQECTIDDDCEEGFTCEGGVCQPVGGCTDNDDCEEGYVCEDGECVEKETPDLVQTIMDTFGCSEWVAYIILIFGGFFGFMFLMMFMQMMMGMMSGMARGGR